MYHILCSGFVRFESMDVIRGNFRLETGEDSSCKDGGGLEHCSGELDFMHQLKNLHPVHWCFGLTGHQRKFLKLLKTYYFSTNLSLRINLRLPTCPWRPREASWKMFSQNWVRSKNVSCSNLRRGRRATLALSLLL